MIFVGNPPFGKKGSLAFNFILKAIELKAHMIAFILPPNINTKTRIDKIKKNGYEIVYSEKLSDHSFYFDLKNKTDMVAESIFQIYMKRSLVEMLQIETIEKINLKNNNFVQVYTINNNVIKNSNRNTQESEFTQNGIGKKWIDKCDFYIPLRIFNSKAAFKWYESFEDEGVFNIGFGIICEDKDMKNKMNLRNCYTLGTNKVYISKKQLILKEIMRIYNERG
jgi:hypothetical protein